MASSPPVFFLLDGSGLTTGSLVFTTNRKAVTLTGSVSPLTVALQVSINGGAFTSDASLVEIVNNVFTIPSPSALPEGLVLSQGLNTIRVRGIDILGVVSVPSVASITQVLALPTSAEQIPSGIRVFRKRDTVELRAAKPLQAFSAQNTPLPYTFRGFHLYAAVAPGGPEGYFRVNPELITEVSTEEEEDVASIGTDTTLWANTNAQNLRVRVTEEDVFGVELATRLDRIYDVSFYNDKIRFTSSVEEVSQLQFLTYTHNRLTGSLNSDLFSSIPDTDPLYYVFTAVYYDPDTGIEIETPYSPEVLGAPLVLDTTLRDLPGRSLLQIQTDYLSAVLEVNREISLIPGSTTRDVSIDPFASEMERAWFLLDFSHRSQSLLTLLQIDDANGDGVSDDVVSSAYKQSLKIALGLTSDAAVQALIDQQFEKLAINVGETRQAGRFAQGQVVFFTFTKPTVDKVIPAGTYVTAPADNSLGISSSRFRVGGSFTLFASLADSYYNFDRKRYEIVVDVIAENPGASSNVPAGAIKSATGVSGLSVTNLEATAFGRDQESNSDLAARCILKPSSVDTGTEGGYALKTISRIGVLKYKIVKSGDSLMMRDYDPVRRKHIGGKVDIWVQGLRERQVSETFAFTFDIARDIQCTILDIPTLTFRVQDSRVTPQTPIIEILNDPSSGLGVRNATSGLDYDLTGVVILDYQTFRLNTLVPQPVTNNDDVIYADYRFRSVNKFFPTLQPIRRVLSVVGEVSGPLSLSGYALYKTEDPLLEGESTLAKDYVEVVQVAGVPTGNSIVVNDESHILIGSTEEPLLSVGINTATIRVFNKDRSVEYSGPEDPSPDFLILDGTPTTPVKIVRSSSSTIQSGETVSVDYVHDENFVVTYVINDLLQTVQRYITPNSHATADVVVKQAIDNPVAVEITAQLKPGAKKEVVDPKVRTSVSLEFNKKTVGQDTYQSDVIRGVDASDGVDFVVVPFAKMAYMDGCRKLREPLGSSLVHVPSLDQGANTVYVLSRGLSSPTTDGGGLPTEHKGVFESDESFTLAASLSNVGSSDRSAYIVGSSGSVIPGYSDDATLIAEGFVTASEIQAERLARTANRVFLSKASPPAGETYTVSYVVRGDKGSKDILSADVDFNSLGELTVSYRDGLWQTGLKETAPVLISRSVRPGWSTRSG